MAPAEREAAGTSGVLRDLNPAISLLVVGHRLNLFIHIQAATSAYHSPVIFQI